MFAELILEFYALPFLLFQERRKEAKRMKERKKKRETDTERKKERKKEGRKKGRTERKKGRKKKERREKWLFSMLTNSCPSIMGGLLGWLCATKI
jgi:Ni/Co efflux regulator RcnB